ncbi:MAG: peptide-methionine (S)-S-oxide reductase MsrA [Pseudomonadota bacterium]
MKPIIYFVLAIILGGLATQAKADEIVLAGGCFWGVEAVFEHLKGVSDATSGYAGGKADTAQYDTVSTGNTGHAESVRVTYDPRAISLNQLLAVYFTVAHNPTELNYQGPDHGTQYRSAIFYASAVQKQAAENFIAKLEKDKTYSAKIVTTLEPLNGFYPAEAHHQNFAALNPNYPYIVAYDAPKVAHLQKAFPALYREE